MSDLRKKPFLSQLWMRLTEPAASIQEPERRHQAQFLATVFLILGPIGLLGILLPTMGDGNPLITQESFFTYVIATSIAGMAYFLSRTKWYKVAAWVAVTSSSFAIFAFSSTDPTPNEIEGLFYLIVSVLLGGILLSIRATAIIVTGQIIGLLLLPLFLPGATWTKTLPYPLAFQIIVSVLILLVARQRNLVERDRQAGLELRIAERTQELTLLNKNLKQRIIERESAEKALADERNLLRTLIDNLPDYIVVKDRQNRFVLVNAAWVSHNTDNEKTDRVVGKTDHDYFPDDLADEFRADEQRLLQSGQSLIDKEEINSRPGQIKRWMLTSKVPLRDSTGQVTGLVGVSRDITLRKQMEESLQKAHDELEQRVVERTEALSQANTELHREVTEHLQTEIAEREHRLLAEALRDTAAAINSTLDLQEVLDRILIQIERVIPYDTANIMLHDSNMAFVVHSRGYVERGFTIADLKDLRFPIHETENLRDMYKTGKPFVVKDTQLYAAWLNVDETNWIRSYMGAPIWIEDQVIGYINLDSAYVDAFTQNQAEKLQAFANQAAIAIRNARLYDAVKDYVSELEALRDSAAAINSTLDLQEVLDRILIQIERVIPYQSGSIMLLDGQVAYVVHGRGYVERGFKMADLLAVRFAIDETENLRTMFETGEPLIIFDTLQYPAWRKVEQSKWIHSYIGAPISTDDQVIGFINLDNAQVGAFSQDQARKLGAFANQAAIAIRNARLYDAAKGYAAELEERVGERTEQLERQRAQLQSILDSMHEGVVGIMFGPDMRPQTRLMNRVMVTLTGYTPEEWDFNLLRSQNMTEEESAEVVQGYQRAMEKIGFWQQDLKVRRKDGSEFDGELTVTRVNDLDGKMIGIVIVTRDVSQEKILQEQRSRFVANASHELRTPITNVLTRLYLLRKQPERLPEHLEILENVAGRMRDLVEDLLEHSRFERGVIPLRQEKVDLRLPIIDVIRIQQPEAESKNIQLSHQEPERPLMALVDAGRMIQVFTNLITNAINYTPDGGQVNIECSQEINEETGAAMLVVRVQDSGIGIKPDLLLNIFRPFYRGNEHTNGTGLGLSIAKEIVEMHGGTISVASEVGKGSCFTVRLALIESDLQVE